MKKKKRGLQWVFSALLGFICALVLGALFYGTMVYQLGDTVQGTQAAAATPAPIIPGQSAQALFPGKLLTLSGAMTQESAQDVRQGESLCRVVKRTYSIGGVTATAVSAYPAAVLSFLSEEGFVPQLITGFSLAGLDAVCEQKDGRSLLIARDGECVYILEAQADEQTLYALGAGARLE